jgi:hypothetical protein
MTTVYFICVHPALDLELADRERCQIIGRGAFSTRVNFLPTCIRQRHGFSILGRANAALLTAVLPPFFAETPLVARTGHAMTRRARELAACLAAVLLPSVVSSADRECDDAPAARQHVNRNARVQGSGCDRQKFGREPGPWDE